MSSSAFVSRQKNSRSTVLWNRSVFPLCSGVYGGFTRSSIHRPERNSRNSLVSKALSVLMARIRAGKRSTRRATNALALPIVAPSCKSASTTRERSSIASKETIFQYRQNGKLASSWSSSPGTSRQYSFGSSFHREYSRPYRTPRSFNMRHTVVPWSRRPSSDSSFSASGTGAEARVQEGEPSDFRLDPFGRPVVRTSALRPRFFPNEACRSFPPVPSDEAEEGFFVHSEVRRRVSDEIPLAMKLLIEFSLMVTTRSDALLAFGMDVGVQKPAKVAAPPWYAIPESVR